MDIEQFENLQ